MTILVHTTLIIGPQRIGKTLVANSIHRQNARTGCDTKIIDLGPNRREERRIETTIEAHIARAKQDQLRDRRNAKAGMHVLPFPPLRIVVCATTAPSADCKVAWDRTIILTGESPASA